MMSVETIKDIAEKFTREAKRNKKQPRTWEGKQDGFRIPALGDYVPVGWERTERKPLFVDMSGWGEPGELAMTQDAMFKAFTVGLAYALIEQGQFQGYVAEYRRVIPAKSRLLD